MMIVIIIIINLKENWKNKFKEILTGQTGSNGTNIVEIMVSLKYLSNFLRNLKCH